MVGNFSSGESRKLKLSELSWKPGKQDHLEYRFEENGKLTLEASSLGKNDKTDFELTTSKIKKVIEENKNLVTDIENLALKIEIQDTNYTLQVFTPRTGNLLLPGGRINIQTVIRKESDGRVHGAENITFKFKNNKDEIWAKLIPEGANASLFWTTPTTQKIRETYAKTSTDSGATENDKKKSAKPLPRRPPVLVLTVKARIDNQTLNREFAVRFLEIEKFAKLDVKINIMDDRTAKDLYGSVAAKDYYVLMVRLFNNLLDEKTKQPTGNSIIAYSGSMEVAVGLEKKYDKKSKSGFSQIISKQDLEDIEKEANELRQKNGEGNSDTDDLGKDLAQELKDADNELQEAVRTASKAIREYDKRAEIYENEVTIANYKAAQDALTEANNAIYELRSISERIYRLRENIARLKYAKRAQIRADRIGLNAAIDDGKWYPVTRLDLSRLINSELVPRFHSFLGVEKMPKLPAPESLKALTNKTVAGRFGKNADPPCYGTITYRPLTFEMVVNTADRRDERSVRSKVFKALNFAGIGTSFVTSFAIPGPRKRSTFGPGKISKPIVAELE